MVTWFHTKFFSVESYLYGFGLAVHPAYRGKNIATEIIKARYPLMKTLNLTLTSTAFTGTKPLRNSSKMNSSKLIFPRWSFASCSQKGRFQRWFGASVSNFDKRNQVGTINFDIVFLIRYADLHKYKEGLSFPGIKSQYFKIMSYTL